MLPSFNKKLSVELFCCHSVEFVEFLFDDLHDAVDSVERMSVL